MLTSGDIPGFEGRLRAMQIITFALFMGVAIFAGVVVGTGALNQPPQQGMVSLIGLVGAVLMFVLHLIVPSMLAENMGSQLPARSREEGWLNIYQAKQIVASALLEGAAFFNLVACMVEHQKWSFGIAATLAVFILIRFPTRTRLLHWLEARQTAGT